MVGDEGDDVVVPLHATKVGREERPPFVSAPRAPPRAGAPRGRAAPSRSRASCAASTRARARPSRRRGPRQGPRAQGPAARRTLRGLRGAPSPAASSGRASRRAASVACRIPAAAPCCPRPERSRLHPLFRRSPYPQNPLRPPGEGTVSSTRGCGCSAPRERDGAQDGAAFRRRGATWALPLRLTHAS